MAGCADLDVVNPNEADAERAVQTAGDVESLIAGSMVSWWEIAQDDGGSPSYWMANASFMMASWPANFGMLQYSKIPRVPITNSSADGDYDYATDFAWSRAYRAIASVSQGLAAIENNESVAAELGPERVARAQAFGKFVLGISHGTLALLYDRAFIIDETVDTEAPQEAVPYPQMLEAALGYLDEAIAISTQNSFTLPASTSTWASVEVTSAELARLASSFKARLRANVARTPAERAAVDWNQVLEDIDAGITETFNLDLGWFVAGWDGEILAYIAFSAWQQSGIFILGMADQSGNYQKWLDTPVLQREAVIDGENILIHTPDLRFAQGATVDEQDANPGAYYSIPYYSVVNNWQKPERGTWRWSWYRLSKFDDFTFATASGGGLHPLISIEEMDLLAAEAHFRLGDPGAAAALINKTRTKFGLNPTDAAGTNTSCVPRLPSGQCGDLFEMLKWEKRMETQFTGPLNVSWYFDGRGWGDLYAGTPLQLPIPCQELQVLQMTPCYTFGGLAGEFASPGSGYSFPDEG
ncbi:MAG: hypothetical protein ACRELV_08380 [Longimicrobiales bacterium]